MKSNFFLRLIILCFAGMFALAASAQTITNNEAKEWTLDKGNRLLAAFAEKDLPAKYRELDYMFTNYVDIDYISKFVIGKYWQQMSKEQQAVYQKTFQRYALAVYKTFPLEFANQVGFEVADINHTQNFADVIVKVKADFGQEPDTLDDILITFRLDKKENVIKIIDLKLGESSLILSYRTRFYEMVAKSEDEMEWFLEDFEDLTYSLEEHSRRNLM